jgi:hypothetical protein
VVRSSLREIYAGMTSEPVPGPDGRGPRWPRVTGRPARDAVAVAGLAGYAWLASGTSPFSGRALLGVLLPGAVLGLIAYGRPPERIPAPSSLDTTGFSYWAICIAALLEWEASAFRDYAPWHPTLTGLLSPLIAPHPVRSAAFLLWLLGGWALVRR